MLGSREKKLVHFRGFFASRTDRFLGEGPFPKIEGRSLNSGKSFPSNYNIVSVGAL